MKKADKLELVQEFKGEINNHSTLLIAHYHGLTVSQMTKLRSAMRKSNIGMRVVKNRLVKIAVRDTNFTGIEQFLTGPTILAYSSDPVSTAKVLEEFSRENDKLLIVGGSVDGKVIDKSGVIALSKMPSLDELRGKIIGLIQAPARNIVGVLQAPAGGLARIMKAKSEK